MKHIMILIVLTGISVKAFSQEPKACQALALKTFEAINNKSIDQVEPFLSNDFTISGQSGDIAIIVLKQLVHKLGNIKHFEQTGREPHDTTLVLTYKVVYESVGPKQAMFVFNKNNQLSQLELLKIAVKTLKRKDTEIVFNPAKVISIPFKQVGGLILVQAQLNGVKRNFLFDSGAPQLIINSRYLNKNKNKKMSNIKGVGGAVADADIENMSVDFYGIKLQNQDLLTMDLSHLEASLKTEDIYGLIGYQIIEKYDILFDYENQVLRLIQPAYFKEFKERELIGKKTDTVPFSMEKHLPLVEVAIGDKTYKLALDCGAERNLINLEHLTEISKHVENLKNETLTGADKHKKEVQSGLLTIHLGNSTFSNSETLFSDITHLKKGYKTRIDGLLGYPIFSKQLTLLSFNREELLFIE